MNTAKQETKKKEKSRIENEDQDRKVEKVWSEIKSSSVKLYGKNIKVRKVVRDKANELPVMTLKEGGTIDHYDNLKRAICLDGVAGFNNYIELVNKRIKELKQ